jgi:hypothetical protein
MNSDGNSKTDLELSGRSGTFDSFVIHSVNRHRDSHIASSEDIKEKRSKAGITAAAHQDLSSAAHPSSCPASTRHQA